MRKSPLTMNQFNFNFQQKLSNNSGGENLREPAKPNSFKLNSQSLLI